MRYEAACEGLMAPLGGASPVRARVRCAYESYATDVRRFLMRRSRCPIIAEDLTQETFIRLMRAPALEAVNDMRPYLFRIASNLLIDYRRAARAKSQPSEFVELERAFELHDDAPDAEEVSVFRDELRQIFGLLDELSASCREIFWLSRVAGLCNSEIAEKLGVCLSTVEKNINRATRHCRSRFAELAADGGRALVSG